MHLNTTTAIALVSLAVLTTAGCAGVMKPDESPEPAPGALEAAQEEIERIREEALAGSRPRYRLDELEEIRVPAAEAWLDRPFRGRYRSLRADHAVRALAQNRPVRLELEIGGPWEIPMVRPDPSARTIREHLDTVARQADWSWSVADGVVLVSDIETRWFTLSSQPGEYSAGLGLRNLNASGGSVSDNGMSLDLDPYTDEIVAQVRNALGLVEAAAPAAAPAAGDPGTVAQEAPGIHSGAADPRTSVTVAPSANLLVVTARPNAMRRVAALLDRFNLDASRVVRITLSLFEVDFRDGEKRDLALNLIRRSSELPLNLLLGSSTATVLSGDGSSADILGSSILTEGGAAIGGVYAEPGKRATGSSAVAQWLDTLGDATIAYDDTVEIVSNRIASVDLTRTRKYISKISQEVVDGQRSTEVEFDDLRTGLVVHLQPTARVDGRITLTLGFSRSSLVGTTSYNFGDVRGETHITDDFNRLLSISLVDGETRLLASLSESETRDEKSSIPFFGRFGLGTSRNRSSREREVVMMVTATVVGSSG